MTENESFSFLERRNRLGRHDDPPHPVIELPPAKLGAHSTLASYWDILSKRIGEVLTVVVIVSTIVTIYSFKMKPVYKATGRVEIESEAPEIQSFNDFYRNILADESFLRTQAKVLESDNLAWQTIEQLDLRRHPAFATRLPGDPERARSSAVERGLLMKEFRKARAVALAPNSRIVEVGFESTDPDLAARVVNTLVNAYIEYNFHKKYDATRQAGGWMEQQLDELKARVEKSQQALVDYERKNAIVNVSDKQNVVEERLADLSKDLTVAESERAQKESLYDMVQSNAGQIALLAQDELLGKLEEKYADLKAQYVDALDQYGPNFPKVVRLRDQVNEVQSLIDCERRRTVERIRNDYAAALGREKLLTASVAQQKTEVGKLSQLLIQHNLLKREFETNQQLYDSLLRRLKDASVSAGLRATNIHVLDVAVPPTIPVRPNKLLNIAVSLMVGLVLGITLAFVRDGLDYSIRTVEDVESLVGAPSLAIIPAAGSTGPVNYIALRRANGNGSRNAVVALTVSQEPGSPLAESYRALRTSILLSTAPRPPHAVLVTSSQPNEGKTCTSLNLSLALAQRGARVLVVDGDLRKPGIAKALGLTNERGLSSVLTGSLRLDEAVQQTAMPFPLWVLPAGPRPPNPAELISSPTMEALLAELRHRFEHVIIDSPPVLMVTDATIFSSLVDGVVLVVESAVTARGALARAHNTLKIAGGRVLGVVINKVNARRNGYYGSYHYHYARYYENEPEVSNSKS